MNIAIIGAGYVGLSLSVLLSQSHHVSVIDIDKHKIEALTNKKIWFHDPDIELFFKTKTLDLHPTTNLEEGVKAATFVIIATPTNYDEKLNYFDTSTVELVIKQTLRVNPKATIVIKSTIPVGYVYEIRKVFKYEKIFFSPEFLREGTALHDNLYPSRIIVGDHTKEAHDFAALLLEGALNKDTPVLFMNPKEAESVKLFANTFLAMRVTFFNELDTYAEIRGLDSKSIIEGVSLDPRIGSHYNNPSFGYGGYCLPKDTKQLLANYENVPNNLIKAIVDGNRTRKEHIANMILKRQPKVVGIYRLTMKKGSENFRQSVIHDIIRILKVHDVKIVVYEPLLVDHNIEYARVINNLDDFKTKADVIVANRMDEQLADVMAKVYTRDLFHCN